MSLSFSFHRCFGQSTGFDSKLLTQAALYCGCANVCTLEQQSRWNLFPQTCERMHYHPPQQKIISWADNFGSNSPV